MRLQRIKMVNHRQTGTTMNELFFPMLGLIGILGHNGAGKSTLFNAICWALFGKIKDVTNAMIKNQQAGKKAPSYVELEFDYNGHHYKIVRDLVSSRCYAQVDGLTKAIGTTSLNTFTEELFKMDYKTFTASSYSQQEDTDALCKMTPGSKLATISKLFNMDDYDRAAENKRREKRELEAELSKKRKTLLGADALREEEEALTKQISALDNEIHQTRDMIASIENEVTSLLSKRELLDTNFKLFTQLSSQVDSFEKNIVTLEQHSISPLRARIVQLEKNILRLSEIEGSLKRYKEVIELMSSMESDRSRFEQVKQLNALIERNNAKVVDLRSKISRIDAATTDFSVQEEKQRAFTETILQMEEEITSLREAYQRAATSYEHTKKEIQSISLEREKYEKLGDDTPCPTCDRTLGEHYHSLMKSFDERILPLTEKMNGFGNEGKELMVQGTDAKKSLDQTKAESKALSEKIGKYHLLFEQKNGFVSQISDLETEVTKASESLASLGTPIFDEETYASLQREKLTLQPLYDENLRLESSVDELPSVKESLSSLEVQVNETKSNLSSAKEALVTLNFDEEAYRTLSHQIKEKQDATAGLHRTQNTALAKKGVVTGEVERVSERLREMAVLLTECTEMERRIVLLAKLDETLKACKLDMLGKLTAPLSAFMSEDLANITNGKYHEVEIDEEYNVFVYREGHRNPLSFYSGGEQRIVALLLRLSISRLLAEQAGVAQLELIALDEVMGSLDPEHQDQMMNLLRNLNDQYPQVLVVTHSEGVKELFDYTIEVQRSKEKTSHYAWSQEWDDSSVREYLAQFDQSEALEEESTEVG